MKAKPKPNRKTVRAAIRGSVPDGKLKRARIVLADIQQSKAGIGGFTEFATDRKTVSKLGAPVADDSFGIVIRGHETAHATVTKPGRKKAVSENEALASQIVDDVNVESLPLPAMSGDGLTHYRRDHLAVALNDLRGIVNREKRVKAGNAPDTIQHRNGRIACATRVLSMLRAYGRTGCGNVDTENELAKVRSTATRKLRDVVGEKMFDAIRKVATLGIHSRTRNRAIALLTSLMETAPTEDNMEIEDNLERGPESDLLSPVVPGSAAEGHMEIRDLRPKSQFCSKEKQVTRRYSPDGVILNASRYVNAIVSGEAHGLFARRVRNIPGGTVLIDASGSMEATAENLSALCKLVPTATVGYYSGGDGIGKGVLTVYALKGKRFDGPLPENTLLGGNAVDLLALRWLLSQPEPWTLISDLGFCGGTLGSEAIAHAIVEREQSRGKLAVIPSLDAAYEQFGGKGNLSDAAYPHEAEARKLSVTMAKMRRAIAEKKEAEARAEAVKAEKP